MDRRSAAESKVLEIYTASQVAVGAEGIGSNSVVPCNLVLVLVVP